MSSDNLSPRRIFSHEEAAALLPEVRRITEGAHLEVADEEGFRGHVGIR